ncbi:PLP-dependent aminotransferase family protein [Phreatobacter aquaticus]|uniref:PLP-dependent aminotransferase family protein n=1 Tax=Phreatobacter aquaticus TaxID=2570229 RepID=A0A4D7QMH7_9HYPH|nr:PLP-dependent aminotransferase family protein [Phreatobacter aquaticus]QCK86297.1 PLP-dependent aminotransferase family protein [Phreatobacter aquaticus]
MDDRDFQRRATRTDRIVGDIAALIDNGALKPGERVASVRRAAADQGVSKNTMAEAYDRLVASGHLVARAGSGYFVAIDARPPSLAPRANVAEALDLVSLLREQFEQHYEVRPGDGRPPPSWMENSELGAHFGGRKWHRGETVEHGYGSSWGYRPLRERIAVSLGHRSIKAAPEQILLTLGANHALDLIVRQLIEPGDTVFVDDPGYYPLFGKLKLAKARVVGIKRGMDGPCLQDLQAKLTQERPKVFFTQSLAHNPTGGGLSPAAAYGVLQAAHRHGFLIVEDDPFADILPANAPRLAALDQLDRVIYVGTFSKTLSASLRVGYLAASPALAGTLTDIKMLSVAATSQYVERFVFDLIAGGHYLRHLRRLRARIESATEAALGDLAGLGLSIQRPDGGFYLWARLPEGTDEIALCRQAAAESIFLAPGQVFSPERDSDRNPAIRINVAHASDQRFLDFLSRTLRSTVQRVAVHRIGNSL